MKNVLETELSTSNQRVETRTRRMRLPKAYAEHVLFFDHFIPSRRSGRRLMQGPGPPSQCAQLGGSGRSVASIPEVA